MATFREQVADVIVNKKLNLIKECQDLTSEKSNQEIWYTVFVPMKSRPRLFLPDLSLFFTNTEWQVVAMKLLIKSYFSSVTTVPIQFNLMNFKIDSTNFDERNIQKMINGSGPLFRRLVCNSFKSIIMLSPNYVSLSSTEMQQFYPELPNTIDFCYGNIYQNTTNRNIFYNIPNLIDFFYFCCECNYVLHTWLPLMAKEFAKQIDVIQLLQKFKIWIQRESYIIYKQFDLKLKNETNFYLDFQSQLLGSGLNIMIPDTYQFSLSNNYTYVQFTYATDSINAIFKKDHWLNDDLKVTNNEQFTELYEGLYDVCFKGVRFYGEILAYFQVETDRLFIFDAFLFGNSIYCTEGLDEATAQMSQLKPFEIPQNITYTDVKESQQPQGFTSYFQDFSSLNSKIQAYLNFTLNPSIEYTTDLDEYPAVYKKHEENIDIIKQIIKSIWKFIVCYNKSEENQKADQDQQKAPMYDDYQFLIPLLLDYSKPFLFDSILQHVVTYYYDTINQNAYEYVSAIKDFSTTLRSFLLRCGTCKKRNINVLSPKHGL